MPFPPNTNYFNVVDVFIYWSNYYNKYMYIELMNCEICALKKIPLPLLLQLQFKVGQIQ